MKIDITIKEREFLIELLKVSLTEEADKLLWKLKYYDLPRQPRKDRLPLEGSKHKDGCIQF